LIERDRTTYDATVTPELRHPELVAEHHDVRPRRLFGWQEATAKPGLNAKRGERIPCYRPGIKLYRRAESRKRQVRGVACHEMLEDVVAGAQVEEIWKR